MDDESEARRAHQAEGHPGAGPGRGELEEELVVAAAVDGELVVGETESFAQQPSNLLAANA